MTLQATNSAGTYEVDGVLLVQAPPRWVQEPEDAEVLLLFSALQNFETFFVQNSSEGFSNVMQITPILKSCKTGNSFKLGIGVERIC